MLEIKDLHVSVIDDCSDSEGEILKGVSLNIKPGEVHAIMGPNGTGKSTLSKTIMGNYKYKINSGKILFNGVNINDLEVDERAKLGIFLCMQDPMIIEGVSNSEFIRTAKNEITGEKVNLFSFVKDMEKNMEAVGLDKSMMHRSLNSGFSGGEKKKNEILQMLFLKPKLIILDELDSGLDVDSLRIICKNINNYLSESVNTSVLIITHYPRILEYIKPDFVHIMNDGVIQKTGDMKLAFEIDKSGYGVNVMIGNDTNE